MEIEFGKMGGLGGTSSKKCRKIEVVLGVNGVVVGRYGLILWENEATGAGKVSRCLWDHRDAIF